MSELDKHRVFSYYDEKLGKIVKIQGSESKKKKGKARPKWPLVSNAAAVHPTQVKDFSKFLKKQGAATEFTKSGDPIFQSHAHRRKHLKARGMYDKLGYL
jgi:hypothetical protein